MNFDKLKPAFDSITLCHKGHPKKGQPFSVTVTRSPNVTSQYSIHSLDDSGMSCSELHDLFAKDMNSSEPAAFEHPCFDLKAAQIFGNIVPFYGVEALKEKFLGTSNGLDFDHGRVRQTIVIKNNSDDIVGYCTGYISAMSYGPFRLSAEVEYVYIIKAERNKGACTALMTHLANQFVTELMHIEAAMPEEFELIPSLTSDWTSKSSEVLHAAARQQFSMALTTFKEQDRKLKIAPLEEDAGYSMFLFPVHSKIFQHWHSLHCA